MSVTLYTAMTFQLQNQQSVLEYEIAKTQDAKMALVETSSELTDMVSDFEPDSPVLKSLESRKDQLYLLEKQLDKKLKRDELKLRMVESRLNSYESKMDQAIQTTFR